MPFALIPFLLLAIPLMEIAAFIVIGGQIGVFPTLGIVFITAVIGSFLLRSQGLGLFQAIQREIANHKIPAREMVHGVMIMIAGVLLLTPGFVTDSLGFALFVPPIRDAVWHFLKSRITVQSMGSGSMGAKSHYRQGGAEDDDVIDLSEEEFSRDADPSSPWSPPSKQ